VNKPIARLFTLVLLMFGALVAYTSRWTVFDASAVQNNALNKRTLLESEDVPRGTIYGAGGAELAYSRRTSSGTYVRRYPFGALFGQPIGYSISVQARATGVEAYRNNALAGTPLEHESIVDQLEGHQAGGDEVDTTLVAASQRVAMRDLQKTHLDGAVVAIVPSTGAITVFASNPSFDPNAVVTHKPAGSQFDQAAEGGEFPGSAQKVVTAVAAIDSGKFTPASTVDGNSPQSFFGIPLNNDGGTSYGPVSLGYALTNSINTVYAQVALKVGPATLQRYMDRLGFYATPPVDLPSNELAASGVLYPGRAGYLPLADGADVGRVGIGEGGLVVTPLQMAMVAAAVANGGRLMRPHLTDEILNSDGQVVQTVPPRLYSVVMKPSTARTVGQMMENVVHDGTGTAAALAGITVAGKTGTAQDCANLALPACQLNQVWFIAYAPVDHPRIAVAVTLPHQNGFGGTIAAPIARAVIQALLEGSG